MVKKNIKIIIAFIIGIILSGTISVYALYIHAKDVSFTPTNEGFNVENVNSALDYLYEHKNNMYVPIFYGYISTTGGGRSLMQLKTNGLSTLSIEKRQYNKVAGETYFAMKGFEDEECKGASERFFDTQLPSTNQETFDVSKYACIQLIVHCYRIPDKNVTMEWATYSFEGIHLYNE